MFLFFHYTFLLFGNCGIFLVLFLVDLFLVPMKYLGRQMSLLRVLLGLLFSQWFRILKFLNLSHDVILSCIWGRGILSTNFANEQEFFGEVGARMNGYM